MACFCIIIIIFLRQRSSLIPTVNAQGSQEGESRKRKAFFPWNNVKVLMHIQRETGRESQTYRERETHYTTPKGIIKSLFVWYHKDRNYAHNWTHPKSRKTVMTSESEGKSKSLAYGTITLLFRTSRKHAHRQATRLRKLRALCRLVVFIYLLLSL